ncbi:hypothetical protein HK101_012006 [Irineochytrium annulatum]|nr:hypothetical protein HK101_012006 [Irineochytrium annulatum]
MSLLLPPPPSDWDKDKDYKIHVKTLARLDTMPIEPVGAEFLNVVRRIRLNRSLEEDLELEAALHAAEDEDVNLEEDEPETKKLLASDPQNWKQQDHYAVLGISKLRWKATDDDIKRAYRRKVLKHHPDKKAASSGNTSDDSFFKCIQKAWEVLSDNTKRRQWDSVDPEFDETVPTGKPLKAGEDFFEIFNPVIEKESRFSKNPLPPFGDADSPREVVEAFYEGWFNFDSWRTFEMLDEEDEGGDSREEKRYYERKNKAARAKLKKEDNARLTRMVEAAFKNDPRIQRIKEEEKAAKEAKKKEKEWNAQAAQREAEKKAEEERIQKEKDEKEEKERREVEKKEREAHKKLVRKAKKAVKDLFKDHNNFLPDSASGVEIEDQVTKFDTLLENSELWHLEEFKIRLDLQLKKGTSALQACFEEEFKFMQERLDKASKDTATAKAAAASSANSTTTTRKAKAPWSPKEQATLIKAIKSFPGGTVSRWEKIADYVNLHAPEDGQPSNERGPEECIKKSKELQEVSMAERTALQQVAAASTKKKDIEITDAPTERDTANTDLRVEKGAAVSAGAKKGAKGKENANSANAKGQSPGPASKAPGPATPNGKGPAAAAKEAQPASSPAPTSPAPASGFVVPEDSSWTSSQQAELEAALRKFPASQFTSQPSERWEKIATEVTGKNKKEVKQRVKDLAEAISKKNKKTKK